MKRGKNKNAKPKKASKPSSSLETKNHEDIIFIHDQNRPPIFRENSVQSLSYFENVRLSNGSERTNDEKTFDVLNEETLDKETYNYSQAY